MLVKVRSSNVAVMIRRSFRVGLRLGLLAGIAFAVFKVLQSRRVADTAIPAPQRDPWPPVPAPPPVPDTSPTPAPPPVKQAAKAAKAVKKATKATKKVAKKAATAWVEPEGGVCPPSHPIKAKIASKIFHMPGMLNYTRTRADRCYATDTAAKRDGFTAAKR